MCVLCQRHTQWTHALQLFTHIYTLPDHTSLTHTPPYLTPLLLYSLIYSPICWVKESIPQMDYSALHIQARAACRHLWYILDQALPRLPVEHAAQQGVYAYILIIIDLSQIRIYNRPVTQYIWTRVKSGPVLPTHTSTHSIN